MSVKLAPPLSRSPAPHACSGCERDTLHGGQIVFDTLSLSLSLDRFSIGRLTFRRDGYARPVMRER